MSLFKSAYPEPTIWEFIATFCICFSVMVIGAHYGLLNENSIEVSISQSAAIATGLQIMKIRDHRKRLRARKCREQDAARV